MGRAFICHIPRAAPVGPSLNMVTACQSLRRKWRPGGAPTPHFLPKKAGALVPQNTQESQGEPVRDNDVQEGGKLIWGWPKVGLRGPFNWGGTKREEGHGKKTPSLHAR